MIYIEIDQGYCSTDAEYDNIFVSLFMDDPTEVPLNTLIDLTDPPSGFYVDSAVNPPNSDDIYFGGIVVEGNVLFTTLEMDPVDVHSGTVSGTLNIKMTNIRRDSADHPLNEKGLGFEVHWKDFKSDGLLTDCR